MAITLDDLLALLPDNASGQISAADMRQIVTALWDKSSGSGQVAADGTMVQGPAGWTSELVTDGVYRVTHNLGIETYAVQVTPLVHTVDGWSAAVQAITPDSFTFGIYSVEHGGLHGAFANFSLAVTP